MIYQTNEYPESIACSCGNHTYLEGFFPCSATGEPLEDSDDMTFVRCDRCGDFIASATIQVRQ